MWAKEFSIGEKFIGDDHPTFIIAEAGDNHNGDIKLAKKLIDVAYKSGADAVKFQTFLTEKVTTFTAKQAQYQIDNTGKQESQYEMIKKLELSFDEFQELFDYANSKNLIFLSTPFDLDSVDFLANLGVPAFKVASGEIINTLMLKRIVSKKLPIILSSGMAKLGEIESALNLIHTNGETRLALLHCITSYPAPYEIANLLTIKTLKRAFQTIVGFSDHTLGTIAPVVAVALGAKVVEKHFTLDKNMEGPDHKASLDPEELNTLVKEIRITESLLGTGIKEPAQVEKEIALVARRSIVASKDLFKGETLTEENLELKRPAGGLSPIFLDKILNQKLKTDVKKDEFIEFKNIEWE